MSTAMRVKFTVQFADAGLLSAESQQAWLDDVIDAINQDAYVESVDIFQRPTCGSLTGHLPGADHRAQECPTYHD